jgi:hypothetical protein
MEYFRLNCPMKQLNFEQETAYDNAISFYLSVQTFQAVDARGPKVRDHDHITDIILVQPIDIAILSDE